MKIRSTLKPERHHLNQQNRLSKSNIRKNDLTWLGFGLAALVYLTITEPLFITTFAGFSLLFFGLWHLARTSPMISGTVSSKISFWQVISLIISLTIIFSTSETPAHAIFLGGLEDFFRELATEASRAGGESIDENVITLIFNLIRGVFLLLVAAASLFAYNQAQQGNDWRPIIVQIGLAFGIVIAIDIITFLFIGGSTA